ncbi:AAA family ATPase [Halorubrum sp. SS5]|uniref:Replication factor C small subunit n=1 Tax=Halorubrum salinarum TaxID=2739057 RepID=A0A7D4BWZ4_9EURY|nr:AAA family ATPase [Halorubrum salinarum]QKG92755.1 AAA family ATPase [Halorubrum salinarum]TKX87869.1 AAA family ATPase [Halorubrum sp. SS5]
MDGPLWTDTHAPDLDEIRQDEARDRLRRAVDEPMNLVVQGPPGVGKTAAARALAEASHADPDADLIEINVADFFGRTKKEIRTDPRFEGFLAGRSSMAKRDMINRVLKESASYAPMSGEYKTVLLDNAEAIREDFQQALRRVMEKHHRTTQFVIATRQPSKLIAPIRSRCFPVRVRSPTTDETIDVLEAICEREGVDYDGDGLEFVASAAGGDLREAILSAQATAVEGGEVTMSTAYETLGDVGDDDAIRGALADARAGDLKDARSALDDLLEEGYDGQELLRETLRVARAGSEYGGDDLARLHALAGEADLDLSDGLHDTTHLVHLLAAWAAGRTELSPELRDAEAAS